MASTPDGSSWFDVAVLEPDRTLELGASLALPTVSRSIRRSALPRNYVDSTWGLHLRPTEGGGTRLLTTGWARGKPRWLSGVADWLVWGPAHWIMQTKQSLELRHRAERMDAGPTENLKEAGPGRRSASFGR